MKKMRNVSWSEISTWCACRAKWNWSYGLGLAPKRIERAPSVGSCGHAAVAAVLRGESWQDAIALWYQTEIKKRPMFDEELAEVASIVDLIEAIMPRYLKEYTDKFETVLVEHRFEVPVRGIKAKLIGYWDAIVRDDEGKLWLMETKFPQRAFRDDRDLELDGQIGVYQHAAMRLGHPVVGTIFNQILARLPAEPNINKNGTLSRAKIYSDWPTYRDFATKNGIDPADYIEEMQDKLAGFKFFMRHYIYRPDAEVRLFARDMERRIWDMRSTKKHIYRNESFMTCGRCSFRELCIETVKGGDVDYIISTQFEPKKSREEEAHVEIVESQEPGLEPGV